MTGAVPVVIAGCAGRGTEADELNRREIEHTAISMTNERRTERGLAALEASDSLTETARRHSRDMMEQGYVAHEAPDGTTAYERIQETGLSCEATGENIHQTWFEERITNERGTYTLTTEDGVGEDIVAGFMNSPPHRETMLDSIYDRIGLGVSMNQNGKIFATQNFCG